MLIDQLIQEGWLKTPRIIEAFMEIKRVDFLSDDAEKLAELNEALSIGHGQTISQPLVVAFMLEQLQPKLGEKILDIGSGSGWTTALLSHIVGGEGLVIGLEIIRELKEFGESNVAKYSFIERGIAQFVCVDGSKGYSKEAPFDKILASATAGTLPSAWKEQLKVGGTIVTPIGSSIWVFKKTQKSTFVKTEHPGFVFVPLVSP